MWQKLRRMTSVGDACRCSAGCPVRSPPFHLSIVPFKYPNARRSLFFFQAEDGIRDPLVTGVQTCALPISGESGQGFGLDPVDFGHDPRQRSEERRVGKECRSRWSPYHSNKKASLDPM